MAYNDNTEYPTHGTYTSVTSAAPVTISPAKAPWRTQSMVVASDIVATVMTFYNYDQTKTYAVLVVPVATSIEIPQTCWPEGLSMATTVYHDVSYSTPIGG